MIQKTSAPGSFGPVELFAPVTPEEFLSTYWEKQMLHVKDRGADYYAGVFSIGDVDAALPRTRPTVSDAVARTVKSTDSDGPSGSFYRNFLDGSTVNINHVDRQFPSVNILCRKLEQLFHFPASANLYLTPPNSQGFRPHYDRHDVFVLQIAGEKRWEIWPSDYLALRDSKRPVPENRGDAHRIVLRPGDMLYLPRGYVHQAFAEEQMTLHLTLPVEPLRWLDLACASLRIAAERQPALRKSLPPGFLREMDNFLLDALEDFLGCSVEESDIRAAVLELGMETLGQMTPVVDNRFETLGSIATLNLASILRKREGTVDFLEERNGSLCLHFGGEVVTAPQRIRQAIEFVMTADSFPVSAIPGLDDASKLIFSRRLVTVGYVKITG